MSSRRKDRRRAERAAFEAAAHEHSLAVQLGVHSSRWFWARAKVGVMLHLYRPVDYRALQDGYVPACGFKSVSLVALWRSQLGPAEDPLGVLPRHVCVGCRKFFVIRGGRP